MISGRDMNALIGEKVQWRMSQNDDWKPATIIEVEGGSIVTFGEYWDENVYFLHQAKVLFESATLEYIYCMADDGSRFHGYAILEAVIYPMQHTQNPQWSEPKCLVSDLPVAVVNGCAYAIDQLKDANDRSEFSRKRPDLAPALAIMFQPK